MDLQRLGASLVLAARSLNLNAAQQCKVCRKALRAYRKASRSFADMSCLQMWVWRPDLERLIAENRSHCLRKHLNSVVAKAVQHNSRQAAGKLCEPDGNGGLRIRHDPPIVWRFAALDEQWHGGVSLEIWIQYSQAMYFATMRPDMRHLLNQFRLVDLAL